MKKLFDTKGIIILAIMSLLFASCSSIDSKIISTGVNTDSVKYDVTKIDPVTLKPTVIPFVTYRVGANSSQKAQLAKKMHAIWKCYLLGILAAVMLIVGIWAAYKYGLIGVVVIFISILVAAGAFGVVGWSASWEEDIPKTQYDSLMKVDGNLHSFWDEKLAK